MSKRWVMVAGALLLLCAAPPVAMAAAESMVTMTLGQTQPMGDFKEIAQGGVLAGLNAGYRATSWLETGVGISYYRNLGESDGQSMDIYDVPSEKWVIITLTENWTVTQLGLYAKVHAYRLGRVSTYLVGGLGSYTVRYSQDVSASESATSVGGSEQANKFGMNGGLGLTFRAFGGTWLGVDARYHKILVRDTNMSFLTTGLTIGFGPGGK